MLSLIGILDTQYKRLVEEYLLNEEEYWKTKYKVKSSSNPKKEYTVSKSRDGKWGCSCPGWIYHRKNCKHIRAVQGGSHNV